MTLMMFTLRLRVYAQPLFLRYDARAPRESARRCGSVASDTARRGVLT